MGPLSWCSKVRAFVLWPTNIFRLIPHTATTQTQTVRTRAEWKWQRAGKMFYWQPPPQSPSSINPSGELERSGRSANHRARDSRRQRTECPCRAWLHVKKKRRICFRRLKYFHPLMKRFDVPPKLAQHCDDASHWYLSLASNRWCKRNWYLKTRHTVNTSVYGSFALMKMSERVMTDE